MSDSTSALPPGVIAERILDYVVADAPPRTVLVHIYQPAQRGPHERQARVVISGVGHGMDHEYGGLDSAQALFEALRMAGVELARYPGLSQGKCKPWEPVGFLTPEDRFINPGDRF